MKKLKKKTIKSKKKVSKRVDKFKIILKSLANLEKVVKQLIIEIRTKKNDYINCDISRVNDPNVPF